jgi:anti-sigma factor RsiW
MSSRPSEHAELLELLRQSLDRELSPSESIRLAQALEANEWLREELAVLQTLRKSLSQLHPATSPAFTTKVLQRLSEEQQFLRPLIVRWRSVAAAACIALLLGLGLIYNASGNLESETILGLEQMELDDVYAFDE